MMSQRQEVLKQLHITPYEKLYQDAEVRRKKMEQKESAEEHVITSAPPARRPGSARPLSRSLGHIPSESSFDLRSMCSLPASDRLHAYHLRKEVRPPQAALRQHGSPCTDPSALHAGESCTLCVPCLKVQHAFYEEAHGASSARRGMMVPVSCWATSWMAVHWAACSGQVWRGQHAARLRRWCTPCRRS